MKDKTVNRISRWRRVPCACLLVSILGIPAAAQKTETPALAPAPVTSPAEKAATQAFENHVKDYVKLRNKVRENGPKLSKDATPEEIQAYRTSLEQSLRNARKGAKRGE